MTAQVSWLIENHVIETQHSGKFTTDDAIHFSQICTGHLNNSDHLLHLLVDHTQTTGFSSEMQRLGDMMDYAKPFFTHSNLGIMVAYGFNNKLIKFMATVAAQLSSKEYRLFDTREEALNHLVFNDPSLADLIESV